MQPYLEMLISKAIGNSVARRALTAARAPLHSTLTGSLSTSSSSGAEGTSSSSSSPYIHPLSSIVLSHLQTHHPTFLTSHSLSPLTLRPDGTFTLGHTSSNISSDPTSPSTSNFIETKWDPSSKKHWLNVKINTKIGSYCLQDNTKPAWHGSKMSSVERIESAVDGMISSNEEAS
ncbi:hypothetical protein TrST_g14322 [Triparma strigata]|uniref:Uncharacterized protein n=1 Tax=Triparma strigata TaxID=1606541 RepID=A0A9W6ZTS9_9STRA|nr:hypothetical protein TrST_g14322 [Triparma strigata]